MASNSCFSCSDDCGSTSFYLVNLQTKKYKTPYLSLIGELINSEYELRVTNADQLCKKCILLFERYDEIQKEAITLKSVLARQIAFRYEIDPPPDLERVYLDKSKIFFPTSNSNNQKFNCKHCPEFIAENVDIINSHVLYHQYQFEEQQKMQPQTSAVAAASSGRLSQSVSITKKTVAPIVREVPKTVVHPPKVNNNNPKPMTDEFKFNSATENNEEQFFSDTLDSLIDFSRLDDAHYDSNLKNNACYFKECRDTFQLASDYVWHLKNKHKVSHNHIFSAIQGNLKRPSQLSKFMCPYCFTNTRDSSSLQQHVESHEGAHKHPSFIERVNVFCLNIMKSSRCRVCDETMNPDSDCNHMAARKRGQKKLDCKKCGQFFFNDRLFNTHLAVNHCQCFFCYSQYDDRDILKDHIQSHLSVKEYPCSFCNEIYQTKSDIRNHVKAKHKDRSCRICSEWYTSPKDLEDHLRYAHADKRYQEKPSICDVCGKTFKYKSLLDFHCSQEHKTKKCFKCSKCPNTFEFRYLLMDHFANVHHRTIVDNEGNFYECFFCNQTFSSQSRNQLLQHLQQHQISQNFCYDCNVSFESRNKLEDHREKSHQDFSRSVDKHPLVTEVPQVKKEAALPTVTQEIEQILPDQQEIIVQGEDGSLLNMNNFILTENGELIIQNFDGLLQNGNQDGSGVGDDCAQIQINLEQFLLEQGLAANTEISYIQGEDGNLVALQNDDGTQESVLQKMIFEGNDIPNDLIDETEVETQQHDDTNILINGDYIIPSKVETQQQQVIENLNAANQSTLDELGDILLEVAAAAEKEKKPKIVTDRDSLWGAPRKRQKTQDSSPQQRRKNGRPEIETRENEKPAQNFSQAYEQFVKGFDAKKLK